MVNFNQLECQLEKFKGNVSVNFVGAKNGYIIFEDFYFHKHSQSVGYWFGDNDPESCNWLVLKHDISNIIVDCDEFSSQITIEFKNNEKLIFDKTG